MNNEQRSHEVSFTPASGLHLLIPDQSIPRGIDFDFRIRSIGRAQDDGLLCQWDIPKDKKKGKPSKKKQPKKKPAKKKPGKKK